MSALLYFALVITSIFSASVLSDETLANSESKTKSLVNKNGWRIQDRGESTEYLVRELKPTNKPDSKFGDPAPYADGGKFFNELESESDRPKGENESKDRIVLVRFQVDRAENPRNWKFVAWKDMEPKNQVLFKPHYVDNANQNEWLLFQSKDSIDNSHFEILIDQGSGNYAYLKAVSGSKSDKIRIPEVLLSAANRTRVILGGTLDQRMVAIYFANKSLIDLDLRYRHQILKIPSKSSLRSYDTKTVGRLASHLRLDGFASFDLLIDDRQAVGKLRNEQTQLHSSTSGNCTAFVFEKGYLKNNLSRLLIGCGWTIGQWRFGDDQYEFDLEITKEFKAGVDDLDELLVMVESTYLLTGTKNLLDKTVDFQPSRGGTLEEMELNKW